MNMTAASVPLVLMFSVLSIVEAPAAQKTSNPAFEGDQAVAVGCLRSINTAEVYYAKEYKKGWSRTLAVHRPRPA